MHQYTPEAVSIIPIVRGVNRVQIEANRVLYLDWHGMDVGIDTQQGEALLKLEIEVRHRLRPQWNG